MFTQYLKIEGQRESVGVDFVIVLVCVCVCVCAHNTQVIHFRAVHNQSSLH